MTHPDAHCKSVEALITLLDQITGDYERLTELIEHKIDAMRHADVNRLTRLLGEEHEIAASVASKEGLRAQLVETIARGFGVAPAAARAMTISQVAARFAGDLHNPLIEAATRARDRVTVVARRNHQAHLIARGVVGHMRHVFAAMTGEQAVNEDYTRAGTSGARGKARILDAVG